MMEGKTQEQVLSLPPLTLVRVGEPRGVPHVAPDGLGVGVPRAS